MVVSRDSVMRWRKAIAKDKLKDELKRLETFNEWVLDWR